MINTEPFEPALIAEKNSSSTAEFSINVADLSVRVISHDPQLSLRVYSPTTSFVRQHAEHDSTVTARFSHLSESISGKQLFDSGALWKLYSENGSYVYRFSSPYFGSIPYKEAIFNQDFSSGDVYLHKPYFDSRSVYPLEYPLDELLFLNLLSAEKGVEVHSSGVIDEDGCGYLFPGASGAGKTTMARLWEKEAKAQILSDDRIILREKDGGITIYGTPWHGEARLSTNASVRLKAIFLLKQAPVNQVVTLTPTEASSRLFATCFPLFYSPQALDFTIRFFTEAVQKVPCFEIRFVPDKSVIDLIRKLGSAL